MQNLVIFFVDFREVRTFSINPDNGQDSPFQALCRLVRTGYGAAPFRMVWSDGDSNLMPLLSDRNFGDALRSRRDPRLPLKIYVKRTRAPSRLGENNARNQNLAQRGPPINGDMNGPHYKVLGENNREWMENGRPAKRRENWDEPDRSCMTSMQKKPLRDFSGNDVMTKDILPKDPSLAELVSNIRQNLEAAFKTVRFEMPAEPAKPAKVVVEEKEEEEVAADEPVCSENAEEETETETEEEEKENDSVVPQTEPEINLEEELMEDTLRPRCFSSLSDEFTIITPSSESCPVILDQAELEAVFSDWEGEDAFEVVDAGDDWDSDCDWNSVRAATT